MQLALLVQKIGQVGLFIAKLRAYFGEMGPEVLQYIRMSTQLKPINR